MRRQLLSLLLAITLVASAACAYGEVTFPLSEQPVNLTAFATAGPYTKGDFNDLEMWNVMEALTNVYFDFESSPSDQSAEKLGLLFASNELPDVIFKTGISANDVTNYATAGQLVAIDSYLADYAPNFSALLAEYPEIRKAITMADGHIYGFPYIVTAAPSTVSPKLFYNAEFFAANNLEEPTTLDEFVEICRLFKDSDWNGNGVADEIAVSSQTLSVLLLAFYGTFGVCTRGGSSLYWDVDTDGNLRYVPTSDGFKAMLQFLNTLYTEGLLDQEIFTTDLAGFQAKAEQNKVCFAFVHNNNYMGTYKADFKGLSQALVQNEGDTPYYAGNTLAVLNGNTFVTSSCPQESIGDVISYFDYFYGDAGLTLYFMGIEGVTWARGADGNPYFTEFVTKNPAGMGMEEVLGTYVCWSGGNNPSVADNIHFGNHLIPAITVEAAMSLKAEGPEVIWPASFTFTEEEAGILADLQLDINTNYVDSMKSKFIAGLEPFENWDAYVAKVEQMGLAEYQEIVQSGLDRYNAIQ